MPISTISTGGIADSINIDNGTLVVDGVNNRVGIGTSSPTKPLTVFTSAATDSARFTDNTNSELFIKHSSGNLLTLATGSTSQPMAFGQGSTERIRIDTSGNLLVGKTSEDATTVGSTMRPNGGIVSVRDGDTNVVLNRKTSDGTIIDLRKDNTTVGSIGSEGTWGSGPQFLGSNSRGFIIANPNTSVNEIIPNVDTIGKLGNSSNRWSDLYLSGGVYLGGTGSANYLEDYEEGNCNLALSGATFSGTSTYTKIGRLVFIELIVEMSTITGANVLTFTNLPFAASGGVWGGGLWTNGWSTEPSNIRFWASTNYIALYESNGAGNVTQLLQSDIGTGGNIYGWITYKTS